jgi:hypothetical protein
VKDIGCLGVWERLLGYLEGAALHLLWRPTMERSMFKIQYCRKKS